MDDTRGAPRPDDSGGGHAGSETAVSGDGSPGDLAGPVDRAAVLGPWVLELARTLPFLVWSYVPGRGLGARTRERLIVAVASAGGGGRVAWAHAGWRCFLGDEEEVWIDDDSALLAYARACAAAGRPVDASMLKGQLPPDVVTSMRATVAHAVVASRIDAAGGAVIDRLRGRVKGSPLDLARWAAVGSLGMPFVAPTVAAGLVTRAAARLAPRAPAVVAPPPGEGNLLVHLLADAAPSILAHTGTRAVVGLLRAPLVIAVRAGQSAATIRIDRESVVVSDGAARDAMLLIDGDIEPLMTSAAGAIVRQFGRYGRHET